MIIISLFNDVMIPVDLSDYAVVELNSILALLIVYFASGTK